jgi:SAM-dependent methyltransferase
MNPLPAILFSDNWNVYQKIIANNYMLHKEFSRATIEALAQAAIPIKSVLDLGCGDAQLIAKDLATINIDSYMGYDLSEAALAQAEHFLQNLAARKTLCLGRMENLLASSKECWDLIYSSYAIHHLSDEGKQEIMQEVYYHLNPKGLFLMIDVMRKKDQSRDAYMDYYIGGIRQNWPGLEVREHDMIANHIHEYDFPAIDTDLIDWATNIGFSVQKAPVQDDRHQMLIMQKQ